MDIKGTSAIVTGGASGLGNATVKMLHGLGARVVIADVIEDRGEAAAKELGDGAVFVKTDVTDEAAGRQAVDTAVEKHGGLNILINCAGIGGAIKILNKDGSVHDLEKYRRILTVNLIGTFNMLRLGAAAMAKGEPNAGGERGVIVNTASVAAYEGQIGQAAYASSKGGIVALSLPAARELARQGIRVNAIAPGIFDTEMLARVPEPVRKTLGQSVPFPSRLGLPEECAGLIQHIIENPMINGESIRIDGALRMAPK
jgi:NAD(P)-dependent dehydrogenase (short-subunit alcohol dehydrogenase family)